MLPSVLFVNTKPVLTNSVTFTSTFSKSPYLLVLQDKMWICHTFLCPFFRKHGEDENMNIAIFLNK